MKAKQICGAVGLSLSLMSGVVLAESTNEGGLLGHVLFPDNDRGDFENSYGGSADALWMFKPNQGISFRLGATGLERDDITVADALRYSATVGYWRYLDDDGFKLPGLRPYLNGGLGWAMHDEANSSSADEDGFSLEAAFGVVSKWDLLVKNLKLRTEVRYNYDDVFDGVNDVQLGLGVHYVMPMRAAAAPASTVAPSGCMQCCPQNCPPPAPVAAAPAAKPEAKPAAKQIEKVRLPGTNFRTGSAALQPGASGTLREAAAILKSNPDLKVEVGGHADSQGDAAKNQALSERRAQSVKDFLVGEGVAANRLTVKGYGEDMPVDSNKTAEGRANNRRVEFKSLN